MRTQVLRGRRSSLRLGLVVALVVGPATVLPVSTARAEGPRTMATWHMDETSGTRMVDSTGDHPGKLHSVTLGRPVGLDSDGTGYGFNGRSSYVSIPDSADLNPGADDVHISFNMMTTSAPATPDWDLVRKGVEPEQRYKVELQPGGQVSCIFTGSAGTAIVQQGPAVDDGKWHSIRCEKFSSSVKLTIDGTAYSTRKSVGSISNSSDMVVGARPGSEFYQGDLDELTFTIGDESDTDDQPPTGTFGVAPSTGWARFTPVTLTQTSVGDDVTAAGSLRRTVDWKDSSGAVDWPVGTTTTHVYGAAGSYTPTVTLTDEAGNSTTVPITPVTVRADTSTPTVGLRRPGHRSSVAAWRVLKGRFGDAGSGVAFVHMRVVEKRGGTWFAYRPASHSWVKAASRAAAFRQSRAGRAVLVGASRWTYRLPGLRKGTLLMRLVAGDHVRNISRASTYTQRLTRR
jgi:hypothetical protein